MFQNHRFCIVSLKWNHFINVWSGFIPNFDYTTLGFLPLSRRVFQNHWFCIAFWNGNTFLYFWNGFNSNCAYKTLVFLNILEIQLQKHWFYNGCITDNTKSIAFISKANLRTTPKNFVNWADLKSDQKLSQTHQKVMKSRQVSEGLKNESSGAQKTSQHVFLIFNEICWSDIWMKRAQNKPKQVFF